MLDHTTAVLFHNPKQDTLVLYAMAAEGEQTLSKRLDRGAFLLPACPEGRPYLVLEASSKVSRLFRS